MPNYKELKKIAIEEDEKTIMRDKIWSFFRYYSWEDIVVGNIEDPIDEEGIRQLTDDIIEMLYEK